MAITTQTSAKAWSPDVTAFKPSDAIPDALLHTATTVVTEELAGDNPVARIPWADDSEADFVLEGETIPEADPDLAEVVVPTRAIAKMLKVSRGQWGQDNAANLLSESTARAITKAANSALLTADGTGDIPLTGLLETAGMLEGDTISTHLDPLADLIGEIEDNHGTPGVILANGATWAAVRKLKVGSDRNDSLVGAGVEAGDRMLLGVPVISAPAVPAGQLVVVDPSAVPSATSQIEIDTSEDFYFDSYSVALRAHWRFGWKVQHANRLGVVPVDMGTTD